jgi:ribosome-associated heat shock protein Hsp15
MTLETLRIDKWLWYARFFKSRTLATRLCGSGKLRLNSQLIRKSHATLKQGDVLTFPKNDDVRVIKVVALGTRRGPASEAVTLYEDLEPPQPRAKKGFQRKPVVAARDPGAGRPTKAERRAIDKLRDHD